MIIEFDANKNERNIKERGLAFTLVKDFDFDSSLVAEDDRRAYSEVRYVAIGYISSRLHVVCFTPITGGIRVISLRKANKREVAHYEQNING